MTKKQEVKRIDIAEFRNKGYLQELNRQFLHPLGLALEVIIDEERGTVILGGIWDYRNDPEGMFFADLSTEEMREKAMAVETEMTDKILYRQKHYGFAIQPIGHKFEDSVNPASEKENYNV